MKRMSRILIGCMVIVFLFTISAIKLFGNNSSLDINYDSSDKFINKNRNSNLKVEMPFENDENTTDKVSNPQK